MASEESSQAGCSSAADFEFSKEDVEQILKDTTFSRSELKALCLRPCTVMMQDRNILFAMEQKAAKMSARPVRPKKFPPDFIIKEFNRKPYYMQKQMAWEEKYRNSRTKRNEQLTLDSLVYVMRLKEQQPDLSVDSSQSSEPESVEEVEADASGTESTTEADFEEVMYTQDTEMNLTGDDHPECVQHSEGMSAGLRGFVAPPFIPGVMLPTDSESTEPLLLPDSEPMVTSSQDSYHRFTGTLSRRISISQVTSTQIPGEY